MDVDSVTAALANRNVNRSELAWYPTRGSLPAAASSLNNSVTSVAGRLGRRRYRRTTAVSVPSASEALFAPDPVSATRSEYVPVRARALSAETEEPATAENGSLAVAVARPCSKPVTTISDGVGQAVAPLIPTVVVTECPLTEILGESPTLPLRCHHIPSSAPASAARRSPAWASLAAVVRRAADVCAASALPSRNRIVMRARMMARDWPRSSRWRAVTKPRDAERITTASGRRAGSGSGSRRSVG